MWTNRLIIDNTILTILTFYQSKKNFRNKTSSPYYYSPIITESRQTNKQTKMIKTK